jgi:N-acylneuraminate cytidylyltransferase
VKILALITARGGSKRLPGKNVRVLGTKPLIVWSIDVARGQPEICDILVSTDAPAIARIAEDAGALVPWLRPPELATDTALSVDVCRHALEWYEGKNGPVDGLLLLQPTSPYRSRNTIIRGIDLFRKHKHRTVLAVSTAKSHPMWCLKIEGETLRPFISGANFHLRSQDLPPAYVVNGALYLIAPDEFRKTGSFYSDDMTPLVIDDPEESIDIDTEQDWKIAEVILKSREKWGSNSL